MNTGKRLRAERERLGMSQTDFGEVGGVRKLAQIKYEKGERIPDAEYLARVAGAGADVLYILTGQRAGDQPAPALSRREAALLDNYRHSSDEARSAIDKTSAAFAQQAALHDHGKSSTAFQQDLKTKPARRAK